MTLKLVLHPAGTTDCATATLTLPEIPAIAIRINLSNLTLGGTTSSACLVAVEANGELVEHLVRQRRQVASCRLALLQLQAAPTKRFIEVVLKPVIDELQLILGIAIALPSAADDPLRMTKALANSAAIGLLSLKQLEKVFGQRADS